MAVTSFGGPLALAALNAPAIVAGPASASAGLAMAVAVPARVLTAAATAFAVYGLWATIQHSGT